MRFDSFVGGSYKSQAITADSERTVNWYVEPMEVPGATTRAALYPVPGVESLAEAYTGVGRAHFAMDGREFVIIGDWFSDVLEDGSLTSHGTLPAGASPVDTRTPATIDSNGDGGQELLIVSSGYAYYYDLTGDIDASVAVQIAALDGTATMGGYLDGYGLVLDADTSTLYASNLMDMTTWDTGTDFQQRNLAPDPWISMKVAGRYVWMFGEQTTEIWQDTGDRFPLAPIPGSTLNCGIAAPWSAAAIGNDVIWLARDANGRICVVRAGGVNPDVISTHPLEMAISGYSDIEDAVGDSYSDQGHAFYLLNFDTDGVTWVWDATTGIWHERGSWNSITHSFESWRPRFHAYAFDQHRVLDSGGGVAGFGTNHNRGLYRMSPTYTTDVNGNVIRRVRRAPAPMNENRRTFFPGFELDLEPGLGVSGTGQGSDPQVMMRMSDDGGKTWGTERMRSAGKMGEYSQRVRWNRLGAARRRVFEVSVTDPIPWRLTGAYLTPSPETET